MLRKGFGPVIRLAVAMATTLLIGTSAGYAEEGDNLREAAQNPIGDLISLPFQNNTNFGIGHSDHTQNVLNIQPVYPVHLNPDWNLITRPILPVIYQPAGGKLGPDIGDNEFGLGDLTHRALLLTEEANPIGSGNEFGLGSWASPSVSNRH